MITTVIETGERVDVYRDRRDIRPTPLGDEMAGWIYREFGSERTFRDSELTLDKNGRPAPPTKKQKAAELIEQIAAATKDYVMIVPKKESDEQPERKRQRKPKVAEVPERRRGQEVVLTDRQTAWLILHFKNTENAVLAATLNICETTLHRLARRYGLKKTKQFMRKCNAKTTEAALAANKATGYAIQREATRKQWEEYRARGEKPSGCFQPGTSFRDRYGEAKDLERRRKAGQTRRETFRKERIRLAWGLEQKTRLNVKLSTKERQRQQACFRYGMKKRGYVVTRGDSTIYYNDETKRSPICEKHAAEFGMKIKIWNP